MAEKNLAKLRLETQTENRLYGDVWLMEQIISTTGLRSDLMQTFDGYEDITNNILTLAMYLVIGKGTLNQVVTWQRISKTPSQIDLSASNITQITQNITNQHRIKFFELWKKRLRPSSLCAVDSTSRSTYGNSLADISWGKNKEKIPLPQTLEVVLYSLSDHMPVYYRSFPGNIPDARSLETILFDLENIGLMNIILVTDRGYNLNLTTVDNRYKSINRQIVFKVIPIFIQDHLIAFFLKDSARL